MNLSNLDKFSIQITSYLDKVGLEAVGLKDIIQKELNLLMLSLMLLRRELKHVIVYKDSKSAIHLGVEQDQVWAHL